MTNPVYACKRRESGYGTVQKGESVRESPRRKRNSPRAQA